MKIAVIGAKGQLGSDLMKTGADREGLELVPFGRPELDVTRPESIVESLSGKGFNAVINTAAYHQVDLCEIEIEKSFQVNAAGVANLADFCQREDLTLLHISTDFVFSGFGRNEPYGEDDEARPLNVYGVSKLAGEQILRNRMRRHIIVRSCGLYGKAGSREKGTNFPRIMLKLAREGKAIKVVSDQTCTPTPTARLAPIILDLLTRNQYGTYHATCHGETTWYAFARSIFEIMGIKAEITPVSSQEYGARARRPAYSVLANNNLERQGLDRLPYWMQALEEFLDGE